MINADSLSIIRVYHNHLRHLRSIVLVVYFLRVTLSKINKKPPQVAIIDWGYLKAQ